ncbi:hypothetical protein MN608_07873 [Microdochium nivale]|nr:hypothetical protein MN608_07873 [Microdochium nivale]
MQAKAAIFQRQPPCDITPHRSPPAFQGSLSAYRHKSFCVRLNQAFAPDLLRAAGCSTTHGATRSLADLVGQTRLWRLRNDLQIRVQLRQWHCMIGDGRGGG